MEHALGKFQDDNYQISMAICHIMDASLVEGDQHGG